MKITYNANLVIALDKDEEFRASTRTGDILVNRIQVYMISSAQEETYLSIPPEVMISGPAIRKDDTLASYSRFGSMETRSLPTTLFERLPRRARFLGGVK